MWKLVAHCKKPGCKSLLPFSVDHHEIAFDSMMSGVVGLLDTQREEIRRQLVNAAWEPGDFEESVKASEHPLPKRIQAVSIPIICPVCDRAYLYSSSDAFLLPE